MRLDVVEAALQNVVRSNLLAAQLSMIWHAGEPLVVPPSFYRKSFQLAKELLPHSLQLTHCIQTNGLLINQEWCELFKEWGVRVGVSLDGPDFIHDRHRKTRDGRPTHSRVMAGIEWLRRWRLPFHVIAVVTSDSLDHASAIVDFFVRNRISHVGFNIDEAEGVNRVSSMRGLEERYSEFMWSVLQQARGAPFEMHVRELDQADQLIRKNGPTTTLAGHTIPSNAQVIPGTIISVDHRGDFTTWSPELLDVKHDRYGDFILGNVLTHSISEALSSAKAQAIQHEIMSGIEACRRTCEFFAYCGGGAPVNKLTESDSFRCAETHYCRCVVQTPMRTMLRAYEESLGLGLFAKESVDAQV